MGATSLRSTLLKIFMKETTTPIFGAEAKVLLKYADALVETLTGFNYEILTEEELVQNRDFPDVARTYCKEIMYRAHWAAATAVLRTHRWVKATSVMQESSNYLGFAASFRGLIESTGDIIDGLIHVPLTIVEHMHSICETLERRAVVFHDFGQLEEKLIHFTHARKLGKSSSSPATHQAKTNTDYIKQLQASGQSFMLDCYAELCQIAHPAAPSLMCFVEYDGKNLISLNNQLDNIMMADFCQRYRPVLDRIIPLSLGSPISLLKVLNLLPISEINTPEADSIELHMPAWIKIEEMLSRN